MNDISEWTRNVESKLIIVIFVQFIQRHLVCDRGSILLKFSLSFFNIAL